MEHSTQSGIEWPSYVEHLTMKKFMSKRALSALGIFTLFSNSLALADLASPVPSGVAPSGAPQSQQNAYCQSVCGPLVNGSGQIKGLSGSTGWTLADDLFCANHGAQTNPNVAPSPVPNAPAAPAVSCSIALQPGDTDCATVQAEVAHCQWHNGQLEQQCMAYEAAGGGTTGEKVVLMLDIAAAGTCGAACATTALAANQPLEAACRITSTSASGAELLETLLTKSSAMSKVISASMGSLGIGMNLMKAKGNFGDYFKGDNGATNGNITTNQNNKDAIKKDKKTACLTAIMMGAMAGARYGNIRSQESTQNQACSQVEALAGSSNTVGNGGMLLPSDVTGGANGTSGTSGSSAQVGSGLSCVGSGGSIGACTASSTVGSDGAALQSSGLAPAIAPLAAQMAPSVLGGLSSGQGSAAQAVGGALGGTGGDIGSAVTTAAAAGQKHAEELNEGVGGMSGGGGGGGGGASNDAPNPMAALAEMMGKKDGPNGGGTQNFQGQPESTDIWHANSPDNLFQIISTKIGKVSKRLQ
jgi:hypothetical protein